MKGEEQRMRGLLLLSKYTIMSVTKRGVQALMQGMFAAVGAEQASFRVGAPALYAGTLIESDSLIPM